MILKLIFIILPPFSHFFSNMSDRNASLFSHEDDKAVIIAIGKANNEGHTSTVYCLEVIGDFRSGDCHVLGKPFRLHNEFDRYIWCNQKLRDDRLKVGSIVLYRESEKNGFSYHRNTGEHMVSCDVCFYVALFAP